ncbi:MAG: hypothetical protein VX346_15705 [Planctomycetota bacterium]|nr:hypothetical protein [Planctomycetota bacterium]
MSEFVFRWATPLRIRLQEREQLRLQLAEAMDLWQQTGKRLAYRREARSAVTDSLRGLRLAGRVDLQALRLQYLRRASLDRQILVLERETGCRHKQVEACRGALLEADRAVRVIQKLRCRETERRQGQQQESEMEQLDQAGATSWLARRVTEDV